MTHRSSRALRAFARQRADWLASGKGTEPCSSKWSVVFEIANYDAGEQVIRSLVQVSERGAALRGVRPHDLVVAATGSAALTEGQP